MKTKVISLANTIGLFVEAHIADLHFGATDPSKQYGILMEQFINRIKSMETLDIVSINGDIFHHKFMANSDAIMYANMFIHALASICHDKGATLLIISGTFEHDADQLKIFYPYLQGYGDIRIIQQVQFDYIKGKRVLIIPELYGKGKSYYDHFLFESGQYDACYLHGTFAGTIFGKDLPDLDSDREPVFCIEHFANCLGPIIAGHNHVPGCHDVYFYYCGCPYRWKFGEEEAKGFMILLHNIKTREHMVHFEPIYGFRYDTVNLDSMFDSDPQTVIQYINELQSHGIDHLRVQFTQNNEELLSVLRTFYRTSGSVKIDANFKNQEVMDEIHDLDTKYKEYDYLFGKSDPESKLAQYINQREGYTFITVDGLRQFLRSL